MFVLGCAVSLCPGEVGPGGTGTCGTGLSPWRLVGPVLGGKGQNRAPSGSQLTCHPAAKYAPPPVPSQTVLPDYEGTWMPFPGRLQ